LKSIDFILAFLQADLDVPVYMKLPAGVNPANVSDGDHADTFSNLKRAFMASSKLATTGLRSSVKGL
jgi:hypothetical protein